MEFDDGLAVAIKSEPMDQQDHQQDDFGPFEDSIKIENSMLLKQESYADYPQSYLDYESHENVPSASFVVNMLVEKCLHNPKSFCYVCGVYRGRKRKLIPIRPLVRKLYSDFFGLEIRDENEPWIPNSVCHDCYSSLDNWKRGRGKGLPFGTPRIWSKPSENHFEDCYFCLSRVETGKKQDYYYPDLPSAKAPDCGKIAPGRARVQLVELPTDSDGIKLGTTDQEGSLPGNSFEVKQELFEEEQDLLSNCSKKPNDFCYICGEYIKNKSKKSLSNQILWKRYKEYFETNDDPPKHPWEPKFSCTTCYSRLTTWSTRKGDGLSFGTPRTWSKPSHNVPIDCYFCMVHVNGRRVRNPHLDIPSSRAPDYAKIAPGRFTVRSPVETQSPALINCKHQPDEFCFICGCHIKSVSESRGSRLSNSPKLWTVYKEYFQLDINPPTHPWEPKFSCSPCGRALLGWYTGTNQFPKFAVPRRWAEPGNDHTTDCYFCLAEHDGQGWNYPDLPSSRAPVPIDADHPRPERRV